MTHLIRQSTTAMELTFREALNETVSVFFYTEYDSCHYNINSNHITRILQNDPFCGKLFKGCLPRDKFFDKVIVFPSCYGNTG